MTSDKTKFAKLELKEEGFVTYGDNNKFSPGHKQPRTPKHHNSSQIDSRRLAGVHHRLTIQAKPRKLGKK